MNYLRQFSFRFYQDDAAPGSATALGNENANISLAPGSKFRIRIGILNDGIITNLTDETVLTDDAILADS